MNLAEFHFIRPYWLLAMLPAIAMMIMLWRKKLRYGNWTACCDAELLPFLLQEKTVNQSRLWLILSSLCTLLVIVALAGPTAQRLPAPAFRNEAALVIALNLSPSMDAADIKPSRLTIARYKIADLLKQRKDGQTALLVYSDAAFTVTPLTDDTNTIASQLTALTTDIMPTRGNNTALVLEKAVALFKQAGLQTGQILLITDSVTKDSSAAVKQLGNYQLSILGIGTEEGAPIALPEGGFLKTDQGSIVVTKLETDTLSNLARAGNGRYQTVTSDDNDIQNLLTTINHPAQQQGKQRTDITLEQWEEQGVWLLLLVLPMGALFFRKGLLVIALLLLLPFPNESHALTWQNLWQTPDQQAMQAYQQHDYTKAAEKFINPAWQAAAHYQAGDYQQALKSYQSQTEQTADSWYNQGNALAQSGQLKDALTAYEKALAINPDDADAKFNAELVKKELEKQQPPPEQKDSQQNQQNSQQQPNKKDQDSKSQSSDTQKDAEKASEQAAEQNEESKQNQQKQEKGQEQLEQQQDKKEAEQKPAEQHSAEQKTDNKKSTAQQSAMPQTTPQKNEKQQADEQWLNRIPDDPAGLLRRKFKYQYGRANQ
jgi:Ca-activated chloride channel homolog